MTPPRLCRGGVFVFLGCVFCVLPDCFVATLLAMTERERLAMTGESAEWERVRNGRECGMGESVE